MFFVYILYSPSLKKYYVGQTNDLERRLIEHNSGQTLYSSRGIPWELIYKEEKASRSEAMLVETKIKKRGIGRFLYDKGLKVT
jgi:putative endonuclease